MTDRPTCRTCVTPIAWIDCPTGGWWAHDTHPADEHDALPAAWADDDPLMERIASEVWEHCRTEGTSLVVDDPRNIAAVAAAVARAHAPAVQAPVTDRAVPSRRAGLRDEIANALEAADYRMDMRRGDLADAVLPVLYREWPWLRTEAEDTAPAEPAADRAALRDRIAEAFDATYTTVDDFDAERAADAVLAVLPAPTDRAAVLREVEQHVRELARATFQPYYRSAYATLANDISRMADEAQPAQPWLSDSARIGRTLIWTWTDCGKGERGEGYRAAQVEARALLTGQRGDVEAQPAQPTTVAYSGKGRTFCVACPPPPGEDAPLTINDVDPWDLCPSCGRHVVDVARAAAGAQQDGPQS